MQPQSKSMRRAGPTAIAAPDLGMVDMANRTARVRTIKVWPAIREWVRRWRQRRELRLMSQREIADFCQKLSDALHEADKPFWRA
jgi:uncharacterized protein YjiS (DUF1127 family)